MSCPSGAGHFVLRRTGGYLSAPRNDIMSLFSLGAKTVSNEDRHRLRTDWKHQATHEGRCSFPPLTVLTICIRCKVFVDRNVGSSRKTMLGGEAQTRFPPSAFLPRQSYSPYRDAKGDFLLRRINAARQRVWCAV